MARSQSSAARRTKPADPYRFGFRYRRNGDMVPLTEDDLLHPQEGDFVVNNDNHDLDRTYLRSVFHERTTGQPGIRVLSDHIIDFQHGGVQPLCPDVTVLGDLLLEWDGKRGTFPVGDMQSRILFAMELTSPSTRRTDLKLKPSYYYRAGIPLLIICDAPYGGSKKPLGVLPYQKGPNGYDPLPVNVDGRFWIDVVHVWIGIENERVVCYDADGARIGDYTSVAQARVREKARADEEKARADEEKARADEEKARADEEKARADEEKARADEEKARADAAHSRIRELEAQLNKSPRRKK
jgi:colicin import membrane protein